MLKRKYNQLNTKFKDLKESKAAEMETRGVKRNSRNELLKAVKDKQLVYKTRAFYLVTLRALNYLYCC